MAGGHCKEQWQHPPLLAFNHGLGLFLSKITPASTVLFCFLIRDSLSILWLCHQSILTASSISFGSEMTQDKRQPTGVYICGALFSWRNPKHRRIRSQFTWAVMEFLLSQTVLLLRSSSWSVSQFHVLPRAEPRLLLHILLSSSVFFWEKNASFTSLQLLLFSNRSCHHSAKSVGFRILQNCLSVPGSLRVRSVVSQEGILALTSESSGKVLWNLVA